MDIVRSLVLLASISLFGSLGYAQSQVPAVNASNVSVLVTLAPGGTATLGFTVASPPAGQTAAWYIVRAVGPSLTQFGIKNPVQQPTLAVYNSQGKNVLVGTSFVETFNYPASFSQVGAFQLTTGALDAYSIVVLSSGTYTVQASDSAGKGGVLLIEAYASPTPIIALD